ncbi:MAG: DUF1697 domain-containing protein [Acidobacteriia bacterium]|nr:DUF1697 domain-containing protein [Terriglobia bacterium]
MPIYISLLRGINVGGHNKVPMERLRALCEELGYEQVQTYIQSGNVVFKAAKAPPSSLSEKIEKRILSEFGFAVSVITRTPEEMGKVIRNSPFVKEIQAEPSKVHVAFLWHAPKADAVKKLEALTTKTEQLHHSGHEIHLYYRDGMGKAKLTGSVIERVLGVAATARNWNTVTKLYEMAAEKP